MYSNEQFREDAVKTARALHITIRRCQFLLTRWYSGMNAAFPAEQYPELNNFMTRVVELTGSYEADGNAKLNTVLALSDLSLPGD